MDKNILKKQDNTYKLIITPELEEKIRFLCARFPNNEYSGVLFYDYTGRFEDNSLVLTAKDFCLMDYGSATYTEFNKKEVNETLLQLANRSFVIKVKYYNNNYYYIGCITNKIPSDAVLFTFKGKDIKTIITDDITDIKETFILNPDKISYIATKLLEFININYGKEQIN